MLTYSYSNAWTSLDHTMYHFIVANNKLREALDRYIGHICVPNFLLPRQYLIYDYTFSFASFFSCPLFSASGTEREMNAVDSEHTKVRCLLALLVQKHES